MPKRISTKPAIKQKAGQKDSNQIAHATIQRTIELTEAEPIKYDKTTISEVMRQLGSKGGKIGGKKRMKTMTAEERTQAALKAARARWAKKADT